MVYLLEKIGVFDCAGHNQINVSTKDFLDSFEQAEIRVGVLSLLERLKFNEKINVAAFMKLATRRRAKDFKTLDRVLRTNGPYFIKIFLNKLNHLQALQKSTGRIYFTFDVAYINIFLSELHQK